LKKKKEDKTMKNAHKKLVGVLLGGLLIATIGAVLATGQTDGTTDDTTNTTPPQMPFGDRHGMRGSDNNTTCEPPQMPFGPMMGSYASSLTDEQKTELEELMTSLREQNVTPAEMKSALLEKLDEFGVLDTQLDNEIAQTEQRLTILNRQKELRNEGYSWDEINNIIEEEFGENATGFSWNMMSGLGHGHGPHGEPQDGILPEESDQ